MGDFSKQLVKYALLSRIWVMSWLRAFLEVIFQILEVIFSNFRGNFFKFETLMSEYWERLFFQLPNHTAAKTNEV